MCGVIFGLLSSKIFTLTMEITKDTYMNDEQINGWKKAPF